MKRILILGGCGMVGQKLARQLEKVGLPDGEAFELTLHDIVAPQAGAAGSWATTIPGRKPSCSGRRGSTGGRAF